MKERIVYGIVAIIASISILLPLVFKDIDTNIIGWIQVFVFFSIGVYILVSTLLKKES